MPKKRKINKFYSATIEGVIERHGVKTYVTSHSVVIKYDPTKTTAEKIQEGCAAHGEKSDQKR